MPRHNPFERAIAPVPMEKVWPIAIIHEQIGPTVVVIVARCARSGSTAIGDNVAGGDFGESKVFYFFTRFNAQPKSGS